MPRRLKEENLRLRALLGEAGMSNEGLARRVVDLASLRGATGIRCDHTSVLRWLGGEQPRPPVPELAAEILSEALGRKVSETELGMTPSDLPGDLGLDLSTGWPETVAASTALWRADVQRRRFLASAVFTSAALPASALRWLTSPPAEAPSGSGPRRVGQAEIDAIRELTHSFREMDNRLGGGKLRNTIMSYLDDHVSGLLTTGNYREETGRKLAAACGELSQLAGWVAYDSDQHGLAQRYLTQALAYARHAGDSALAAEILAAQAHQALYLARRMRRSIWPALLRLRLSVTVRQSCLPNVWSWKRTAMLPAMTLMPAARLLLGLSGHLIGWPAKLAQHGSPTLTRRTWPPGWRSVSVIWARRATPRGTRGAPWTLTAATYGAVPLTCPCLPRRTRRRTSQSRHVPLGGRRWT